MDIDIARERVANGTAVRVTVRLSARETNRLFLSGDTLLQLPTDGIVPGSEAAPIPRMSIFLSELAGAHEGLTRVFVDDDRAALFEAAVRSQLATALEGA